MSFKKTLMRFLSFLFSKYVVFSIKTQLLTGRTQIIVIFLLSGIQTQFCKEQKFYLLQIFYFCGRVHFYTLIRYSLHNNIMSSIRQTTILRINITISYKFNSFYKIWLYNIFPIQLTHTIWLITKQKFIQINQCIF